MGRLDCCFRLLVAELLKAENIELVNEVDGAAYDNISFLPRWLYLSNITPLTRSLTTSVTPLFRLD